MLDLDFYYGFLTYDKPFEYDKHGPGYEMGRQFAILTKNMRDKMLDFDKVEITLEGLSALLTFKAENLL